jgi:hypothetical protein
MSTNSMKPIDVGGVNMVPQGNLNPNQAGSYANLMKSLEDSKKNVYTSGSNAYPGFTPGFTAKGLDGCWQCMTKPK